MSADHLAQLSNALSDMVARAAPSLVSIESRRTRASGFVWRPGLIATAEEALHEDEEFFVTLPGGERAPAAVIGRDASTAVALLRVDRDEAPQLALTNASVRPGAIALAVGAIEGAPLAAHAAVALASGPWRSLRGGEISARIELDRRLRASAYGGVALDAHGNAFGMLVEGPRRRVAIFGAGSGGRKALAELLPDSEVVAFLDSRADGERELLGLPIRKPEAVQALNVDAVIIASIHAGPMFHQLLALGFPGERIEIFPIWRLLPSEDA